MATIKSLLSAAKSNALLILSALAALLAFLLKLSTARSAKLKQQSEIYKAKAHHAKTVIKNDLEAEREYDVRTEELADDIREKRVSRELSDPNDDWVQ